MGPTALIPCSHFCGRDRLGCPHSEDRFDQGMGPESPSGAPKSLDEWKSAADNAIYLSGPKDFTATTKERNSGSITFGFVRMPPGATDADTDVEATAKHALESAGLRLDQFERRLAR